MPDIVHILEIAGVALVASTLAAVSAGAALLRCFLFLVASFAVD